MKINLAQGQSPKIERINKLQSGIVPNKIRTARLELEK